MPAAGVALKSRAGPPKQRRIGQAHPQRGPVSAHLFEAVETAIIENRVQPRYPVSGRATLQGVEVAVRNVSRSGAQLACPQQLFGKVTPFLDDDCVEVALELTPRIVVRAAVVYASPRGAEVLIGLKFDERDVAGCACVDALIRRLEG